MSRIVLKPWGYEEIWAETDKFVGKILYIDPEQRLSLQYHNQKIETIRVLYGKLKLVYGKKEDALVEKFLTPGETFHVERGLIHRFCADNHPVALIEVSTPELDDVVRITDDYSRSS